MDEAEASLTSIALGNENNNAESANYTHAVNSNVYEATKAVLGFEEDLDEQLELTRLWVLREEEERLALEASILIEEECKEAEKEAFRLAITGIRKGGAW